jgi:transposase
VQDSTAGQEILDQIVVEHPSMSIAWADGGYNNAVVNHGAQFGVRVDVVKRPATKGFRVLPRRWVVERTMIHWAMTDTMSRVLTGESTQTWRIDPRKPDVMT